MSKKAGGVLVQAARREQPPAAKALREQVQDGGSPGVLCGGEHTPGLIHHDVEVFSVEDGPSLHQDGLFFRVHLAGGVPLGAAPHLHRAGADEPAPPPCGCPGPWEARNLSNRSAMLFTSLYEVFSPPARRPREGAPRRSGPPRPGWRPPGKPRPAGWAQARGSRPGRPPPPRRRGRCPGRSRA